MQPTVPAREPSIDMKCFLIFMINCIKTHSSFDIDCFIHSFRKKSRIIANINIKISGNQDWQYNESIQPILPMRLPCIDIKCFDVKNFLMLIFIDFLPKMQCSTQYLRQKLNLVQRISL